MIDDPSIDLLRNAIVETPISGLHMEHGNLPTGCYERGQTTIRVPKDQNLIRLMFNDGIIYAFEYLARLVRKIVRPNAQVNVGGSHLQVANEDIAEALIIVLPSVQRRMLTMLIKDLHDQAEPDDLRAGAEDSQNFHITQLFPTRHMESGQTAF